jgi:hypothetical protein
MQRHCVTAFSMVAALQLCLAPASSAMAGEDPVLQAGTRLYLTLDENVSSARGEVDVGSIVRCRVWRDVESRGVVFVKAGAPATCRVDKVTRRNMGGFQGKVSVAGVETRAADGQTIMLSGGYNKEGGGHKAVVWTVGLLLLWPVLFVPGGNAQLPPGTVFDVETVNDLKFQAAAAAEAPRVLNLTGLTSGFNAEFMLDDFLNQPKHEVFRLKVSKDGKLPEKLVIDNVNGKAVSPMVLTVKGNAVANGVDSGTAEIGAKTLAKYFVRGINRFEVAYDEDGRRTAAEVVMDVQM